MNDTTRRFARTLHGVCAAFPRDPQYAHVVYLDSSLRARVARWLRSLLGSAA